MLAPSAIFSARLPVVDIARGLALAAMALYHFAWDLEFFELADLGVTEHLLWVGFARAIAASFLALVGVGLVLGHAKGVRWQSFLRRLAIIVAAAAAITVLSYFTDPGGIIWFGILHCIAVSSVLGLFFLRLPVLAVIIAGMACIAAPHFLTTAAFNGLGWVWLGLAQDIIPSNDYSPLLPWFGYVLLGIATARIIPPEAWPQTWRSWQPHAAISRMLCLAGRHSLLVYLVHQPILMGLLWSVTQIR
ncbi:MAG: heparan-alpha-glucosaminide N-acetyltransferase [Pseudorhodoplanes sp.]|jgi:uncharacterized membrane protein|nr:heparan-alpha-glucosaminide N-acetyltransferase [Pseudorhodoplanes sp.]